MVNLGAYYVLALPLSIVTAFVWHWDLFGLWFGVSIALFLVAGLETYFVINTNWTQVVEVAIQRVNAG